MPRSNREYLLRFAEQVEDSLIKSSQNCARIIERYETGEYEQIAFWDAMMRNLAQIAEIVAEYRKEKM